jgi:hypothetical protein
MNRHRSLVLLAAVALSTATLGACSKGSPTEPTPLVELDSFSATSESSSFGAVLDDGKRRGRGGDDGTADDNGGRGRGGDDGQADDRGGRRGRGGRGHGNDDANDDRRPRQPRQPRQPGQAGLEFEGSVLSVAGQTINLAGGTRVIVDGQTQWIARGDLFTLAQVSRSAASGAPTRVEGRGTRRADGAILALTIKAEVDD